MSSTELSGDRRDTARDLLREVAEETGVTSARPGRRWTTDDPLGIGGLLASLRRLTALAARGEAEAAAVMLATTLTPEGYLGPAPAAGGRP